MTAQRAAVEFLVEYSFQIAGAILIILIGGWVASKAGKMVEAKMASKDIDITLSRFTGSSVKLMLLAMSVIIAMSKMGLSITPLIAAIGALSIGVGLAIQGMLSNYAAGFTIILTRPFVVGDTINVQGVAGLVSEVHLGYTILFDEDDVRIQIPNRLIIGEILHNSKTESLIHIVVGISYDSDPEHAISVIKNSLRELTKDSPRSPLVGIEEFGSSSIDIGVRFWAATERKFEIRYSANREIHKNLKSEGISIPFPQREVRLLSEAPDAN